MPSLEAGYFEKFEILDLYRTPPTLMTTVRHLFRLISGTFSASSISVLLLVSLFIDLLMVSMDSLFDFPKLFFFFFDLTLFVKSSESSSVSLSSELDKINGKFSSATWSIFLPSASSEEASFKI